MNAQVEMALRRLIRDVPDFPKPGIVFKDITPLLADAWGFNLVVDALAEFGRDRGVGLVAAIESRGFIFGAAVAKTLNVGLVPVRKKGKLPLQTHSVSYALEYGTDTLEMHVDALPPRCKVLIVDDVLATGGTAAGVFQLVEKAGGQAVGAAFLMELDFLKGRDRLGSWPVLSLLHY